MESGQGEKHQKSLCAVKWDRCEIAGGDVLLKRKSRVINCVSKEKIHLSVGVTEGIIMQMEVVLVRFCFSSFLLWKYGKQWAFYSDINECNENPLTCGNGGKCVNRVGSYDCICRKGYQKQGGMNTNYIKWNLITQWKQILISRASK